MVKILKLVVIVAIATLMGIWASQYHGYIMVVVADKAIRMNLVAFVFIVAILCFLSVFGYRILKLVISFPYLLFSWLLELVNVSKQEKFVDLVADIALDQNKILKRISISKIIKLTPAYVIDFILFRKMMLVIKQKDLRQLENSLRQISKTSDIYKYFRVYKLYLVEKTSDALAEVRLLLMDKNIKLKPNIVNLAGKIALAEDDGEFAFELLEKHDQHLKLENEKRLIVLALKHTKTAAQAMVIYDKTDERPLFTRVYIEMLIKFGETALAQKTLKKNIAEYNFESKMLSIYVNAFSGEVPRLFSKVCSTENNDLDAVLTLLDLAMMKSENRTFKAIYDYVELNLIGSFSAIQLEKYKLILCKFFIKNGSVPGIDLSETRLVYENT
ncbi:heme biosynthesis protein HemY [Francisella adeliensis]|uniref:Heme biosynthesis protein HemY n=1 Tax=Francisella adeliensis TaxID=2007306 RepID=A0A2Z4XZV6_9GAMM|nr:heme biosynthesis protein HemY [Francisella adeliensis]AXA34320.1 hypothetical protein CDH04_07860 [Francisella adeliensis]MBK2084694.1 heme biosynthesis protein HemY [Francisella adeliensis]MBK2096203.1 heme biosynthesis protein HemY [Francisella adeliensis]QIW12567.1 heme biosynthesis protein HemY [Francisella adeliensis]QIW14440.1 heme biosynthesis protein HemY [Francisella adeliensis]